MPKSITESSVMLAFSVLPDPRKERNRVYSLVDIITTAILGTLCDCHSYHEIHEWAGDRLEWLQERNICRDGVPSHDTYERFFRHLDPQVFQSAFIKWTQIVCGLVEGIVAIDGKTVRGSGGADDDPIHMVSAFSAENRLVLGQLKTAGKGTELRAFELLIDLLDLKKTCVTIDAAGCHKTVAQKLVDKGADYVLALKGNQGNLHGEVTNFYSQAMKVSPEESGCDYWVSEERTRGRTEKREVWACSELDWLPQKPEWSGLRSIVCLRSTRTTSKGTSLEHRYYLSSQEAVAEDLGRAIRSHWSIENQLHWQLDVSYGEDKCRVRKGNGAENLSVLRRATLNILKSGTGSKLSIRGRRRKADRNDTYLLNLLKQ